MAAAPAIKRQVLGRDALVRQLHELTLKRRLLTLTGPGGAGK
ncbi:LuxR family transcriptional regulator, partial [Pseudomonas savastanoi pv. glycinea str. race 4]